MAITRELGWRSPDSWGGNHQIVVVAISRQLGGTHQTVGVAITMGVRVAITRELGDNHQSWVTITRELGWQSPESWDGNQ